MLTAEQAELCHFLLSKTYTLMQKDTFSAREIVLEKRLFMFRPGVDPTSSTLQDRILHKSFRVAVEILRFCLRESSVPRLNEYFVMSA